MIYDIRLNLETLEWEEITGVEGLKPTQMTNLHFIENSIYFLGGMTDDEVPGKEDSHLSGVIGKLDLQTLKFEPKIKKLPCSIAATASLYKDGSFYIVGGVTSAGFSDCVYKVDLKEMKSTQALLEKLCENDINAKGIIELMSTTCVLTEDSQSIVVFGGSTYQEEINKCFRLELNRFNEFEGPITKNLIV